MSQRWHVSEKDGVARKCSAAPGKCPISPDESEHYSSREEAQYSYETQQSDFIVPRKTRSKRHQPKRSWGRKFIAVGSAAVSVVSLSACSTSLTGFIDNGNTESSASSNIDPLEQRAREKAELLYHSGRDEGIEYNEDFIDHAGVNANEAKAAAAENQENSSNDSSVSRDKQNTESSSEGKGQESRAKPWDDWNISFGTGDKGDNNSTSPSDIDGIYFQGLSLTPTAAEVDHAQKTLDAMVVTPEYTAGNYDRKKQFGSNTNESYEVTEQRDITHGEFEGGRAVGGHFIDPYTGETVEIIQGSSQDTNIEHIVPLHEVYQSQNPSSPLSSEAMKSIANDPANLQITGAAVNQEKSDQDAGEWLPSYEPSQCRYAIATITVKSDYQLTMDTNEYNAVKDILDNRCVTG